MDRSLLGRAAGGVGGDNLVAGYASLFDIADHHHDVVAPGAFRRSLGLRGGGRGVRLLWQHDPREPIGVWHTMVEDSRGLWVEGRLTGEVARARDPMGCRRRAAGSLAGESSPVDYVDRRKLSGESTSDLRSAAVLVREG
jgi:phage head maturation protease